MEWLWLILSLIGLGLLWLLIVGMDRLTQRLKANDDARRIAVKKIAQRTAEAEEEFLEKQYAKESAKDFIETADFNDDPDQAEKLKDALNNLSSQELVQSLTKRLFATTQDTKVITADQSAFDNIKPNKVVAKGEGITPVKAKSAEKNALSKKEQKMLKKIKQGY